MVFGLKKDSGGMNLGGLPYKNKGAWGAPQKIMIIINLI